MGDIIANSLPGWTCNKQQSPIKGELVSGDRIRSGTFR